MSEQYTPTTVEVEAAFIVANSYSGRASTILPAEARSMWARWLTQVRREAKAEALCDFADSVRMPFVVYRREDDSPVYVGELMRETAERYRSGQGEGKNDA